jgi:MOSC domain-containing protein YiiM
MSQTLQELFTNLPQVGRVEWIGVRPERKAPMNMPEAVQAVRDIGLTGDRYKNRAGKRQVTLIQWEHLAVINSLLHRQDITPEMLRRNLAVSGINLLALKNKRFQIGTALLEFTGLCHPCSAMESTFGAGGYNAVYGHGGITARIVETGIIKISDSVVVVSA